MSDLNDTFSFIPFLLTRENHRRNVFNVIKQVANEHNLVCNIVEGIIHKDRRKVYIYRNDLQSDVSEIFANDYNPLAKSVPLVTFDLDKYDNLLNVDSKEKYIANLESLKERIEKVFERLTSA